MSEELSLEQFKAAILEDGVIDADEVAKIKARLYEDGIIDREEADFLFDLNDACSGKENDPAWHDFFIEAISDHVLKDEATPGVIDEDEASYLIEKIKGDGQVDKTELALLVNICEKATGDSPDNLTNFIIESIKSAILEDGIVDADEVDMLRKVIYGEGGAGGSSVDRAEADLLFDINDACTGKDNDASWATFFTEAITKHVLEDEESPGTIDEDEAGYLIGKIKGDGQVDKMELDLLVNICEKASGESPESLTSFILSSIKDAILEDGIIDADEVKLLGKVIYGEGGAGGSAVDRAEADFLFDLNDAVSGKDNDPSWQNFFVDAIAKHVLEDETSPGEIDEEEGDWLISKIEGDGEYDPTEKALLAKIKSEAKSISGKLKFKIDMFG
ncbi:hypothetical protein N9N55_07975 [Opitutales bacterium]|nr:hypothetical protein [Opitutales bacterium]